MLRASSRWSGKAQAFTVQGGTKKLASSTDLPDYLLNPFYYSTLSCECDRRWGCPEVRIPDPVPRYQDGEYRGVLLGDAGFD